MPTKNKRCPPRPARLERASLTFVSIIVHMPKNDVKKRNWAFVVYPESAPADWRERLQKSGLQCAISPLHDKDTNPDGEPKKAHYHVILVYGSPTTYNNVKALTNGQLGQTVPQPLEQVRGYYRYLTHADNPEKAQYSAGDIQLLNGFDIRDYVEMTKSEVMRYKRELLAFVRDNDIQEYADLLDVLMDGGEATADLLEVASNHTLMLTKYIASRRYKATGVSRGDD